MMDRIVPGGVAVDLGPSGSGAVRDLVDALAPAFARLMRVYDGKPSLLDRTVSTGVTRAELVRRFASGGFVGRAAGRGVDARRSPGYPPYDALNFEVPVRDDGDVHGRLLIRAAEIEQSIALLRQILDSLPSGEIAAALPAGAGAGADEGIASVESFRGDIVTYVRLDDAGRVARCHPRDPSWFQWPLLEAAIFDNIVADFPLCNKSVNGSYAGHDL
jgi:Ni,Fe-hydrogenase III large subunit